MCVGWDERDGNQGYPAGLVLPARRIGGAYGRSLCMFRPMPATTLRAFGWRPLPIHGDPCVGDRSCPCPSVALCGVKRA